MSSNSGNTGSKSAGSMHFPYATLGGVLLASFALGCVVTDIVLEQNDVPFELLQAGMPPHESVSSSLIVAAVMLVGGLAIQISFLVERVRKLRPTLVEHTAREAGPLEACAVAAGTEAQDRPTYVPERAAPLVDETPNRTLPESRPAYLGES